MKCPKCKELIEYEEVTVDPPIDQRDAYFDILVYCNSCEASFFAGRIHDTDLIYREDETDT